MPDQKPAVARRRKRKTRFQCYVDYGMLSGLVAGLTVSAALLWLVNYIGLPNKVAPISFYLAGLLNAVYVTGAFIGLGSFVGARIAVRSELKEAARQAGLDWAN